MREILFRGKRTDNGEWVYGCYVFQSGKHIIFDKDTTWHYYIDESTVGQYTGLTDRNGKRIFEGDILSNRYEKGVVTANIHNCGCCHSVYGFALCDKNGEPNDSIGFGGIYDEVIGNIHDNPDLLK